MLIFAVINYIKFSAFIALFNVNCSEITGFIVDSVVNYMMILNNRTRKIRVVTVEKNRTVFTESVKNFKLRLEDILS